MPGAEPFFFPGSDENGKTGVLVTHGLGASPDEVRWLGEHLGAQGFTVYGPRVAGHGTDYRDLQRINRGDWVTSVLDGYHLLRAACQRVIVSGLSMGGLLSLYLASSVQVDGLLVLAAPLHLPDDSPDRMRRIARFRPKFVTADQTDFPHRLRTEQMRRGERNRGRVRYDLWATQCVVELYELMALMRDGRLSAITAPTCLIYARQDETVPLSNLDSIAGGLSNARYVEKHIMEKSGHILTQDWDRDEVFTISADFVSRVAAGSV